MRKTVLLFALAFLMGACRKEQMFDSHGVTISRLSGILLSVTDKFRAADPANNHISKISFLSFRFDTVARWDDPYNLFHEWPSVANHRIFTGLYCSQLPLIGDFLYSGQDTSGLYNIYKVNPALSGKETLVLYDSTVRKKDDPLVTYRYCVDSFTKIRLNYADPNSSPQELASAYNSHLLSPHFSDHSYYFDSLYTKSPSE